jgi:hypothetical protein
MSTSTVLRLDLKKVAVWDVRQLNPQIQKAYWSEDVELVEISRIAKRIRPNAFSPESLATVRPSALDGRSGAISQISDSSRDVFFDWEEDGVRSVDILIFSNGALYLSEKLRNVLFSSEFIALRLESKVEAQLLWSILNSSLGRLMLKDIFQRDQLFRPLDIQEVVSSLLDSKVPSLDKFASISFEKLIHIIESQRHELSVFEDKRRSWFQKVSLNDAKDWFYLMTVNDLTSWKNERPIIDLLDEIVLGRHRQRDEEEIEGDLFPLVNLKFVNRQVLDDLDYVYPNSRDALGLPGDLLMASISGKTFLYPLTFKCILAQGVLALRPKQTTGLDELLQVLQSKTVVDQISYFQSKGTLGNLTRKDLELVRIPSETNATGEVNNDLSPLSIQIDTLLWS